MAVLSIDDYFDLPEAAGVQRELLDGRLVEVPAPTLLHAAIQAKLARILGNLTDPAFPNLIVGTHSEFLVDAPAVLGDARIPVRDIFPQI